MKTTIIIQWYEKRDDFCLQARYYAMHSSDLPSIRFFIVIIKWQPSTPTHKKEFFPSSIRFRFFFSCFFPWVYFNLFFYSFELDIWANCIQFDATDYRCSFTVHNTIFPLSLLPMFVVVAVIVCGFLLVQKVSKLCE